MQWLHSSAEPELSAPAKPRSVKGTVIPVLKSVCDYPRTPDTCYAAGSTQSSRSHVYMLSVQASSVELATPRAGSREQVLVETSHAYSKHAGQVCAVST